LAEVKTENMSNIFQRRSTTCIKSKFNQMGIVVKRKLLVAGEDR